ncbi:efflux transporter outer membrane subunit [Desulfovibrio sp. OttesenSCG-928-C06]|nr:efflux transporter outer membrane subunit [Desulfovibrio sp. OttesenSCG-928-C06]
MTNATNINVTGTSGAAARRPLAFRIIIPVILAALLLFTGCTMAPDYQRPDAPIPSTYPLQGTDTGKVEGENSGETAAPPAWRDFFKDETLRRVITLALENNRDLRVSMLNIERTRAQYSIQQADLLPTVAAAGSSTNQHLPAAMSQTGAKTVSRQYSASLGFSAFELDLFGRVRSMTEQALQEYYSVEEQAKSAQLSLVAETAAMYLQLVADREIYDLTQATMVSWEENHTLIRRKYEAGVASDLDLSQAESILNEARVNLASMATQVGQDENALALLMGCPIPEDLPQVRRLADVTPLMDIPEGLPSELLERRPDIRSAEHQLMGANANIGAARANFFPTISLTGSLGKLSADYNNLWDGASRTWSFMPQVSLPIFDMGRNMAQLDVSETDKEIAVARYEKTIQSAFREVADALVARQYIGDRLESQEALVASTQRSYRHASTRYNAGVSSYLNVLDAQRSLYSAQSSMISTRLLRESNALMLYKTLGGGWE